MPTHNLRDLWYLCGLPLPYHKLVVEEIENSEENNFSECLAPN